MDEEGYAMKKIVFVLVIGVVIGLVGTYGSYKAIEVTSTPEFCVKCHEMAPMRASYDSDVHGGAGKTGIRVNCVECHLPHDNLVNYVYTKARNGLAEVKTHFFGDVDSIDWQKNREKRGHFVYDDGCVKCHTNYLTNEKFNKKALKMHKHYEELKGSKKEIGCANCHNEIGHNGLNNMLNIYHPQYKLYIKGSKVEKAKIDEKLYGKKDEK